MKIYIVESVAQYDNFCDDCSSDRSIDKIFDNEEKALAYIQDEIRKELENADEYHRDGFLSDNVPSKDEIRYHKGITWWSLYGEEYCFIYRDYELE